MSENKDNQSSQKAIERKTKRKRKGTEMNTSTKEKPMKHVVNRVNTINNITKKE